MDMLIHNFEQRREFYRHLADNIEQAKSDNCHLGVTVLEILNYREASSQYGYKFAKNYLHEVRNRLEQFAHDSQCVVQISPNSYVILLPGLLNKRHAIIAINKMHRLLDVEINLEKIQIKPDYHAGMSLYPLHGNSAKSLFRKAEVAQVIATKQNLLHTIYSQEVEDIQIDLQKLDEDLISAINNNDFDIYYQPKILLKDMSIIGAEALIRWNHPTRGFISPEIFIKHAENIGLITDITEIVVKIVFQDFQELLELGISHISINLSTLDLRNSEFTNTIRNAASIWGVDGKNIIFEVTESAVMEDEFQSLEQLNQLLALGAGISIDDFGTGYSSLKYFKNIPATELKIDRYFVANMLADKSDAHIIELVISLARFFGLQVVAEGVEDEETLQILADLGCDIIQGFYFSKPLNLSEFTIWTNEYNSRISS